MTREQDQINQVMNGMKWDSNNIEEEIEDDTDYKYIYEPYVEFFEEGDYKDMSDINFRICLQYSVRMGNIEEEEANDVG
jgi:hypothetical protein